MTDYTICWAVDGGRAEQSVEERSGLGLASSGGVKPGLQIFPNLAPCASARRLPCCHGEATFSPFRRRKKTKERTKERDNPALRPSFQQISAFPASLSPTAPCAWGPSHLCPLGVGGVLWPISSDHASMVLAPGCGGLWCFVISRRSTN